MKQKGYYDLLLKINEFITDDYFIKNLLEVKDHKIIDKYLLKQFNYLLASELKEQSTVKDKIKFLNQIISNYNADFQLSDQVLLQVKDNLQNNFYSTIINDNLVINQLFTNANEQELIQQINLEIKTADNVYFIYPFISKKMINKIRNSFNYSQKSQIKIHFITTTFDDVALFVNLDELENLVMKYNNIFVRVEDNTQHQSTRIHIKAAIFERKSGFSTAIIGSSNLTYKGMVSGREWNLKISEFSNSELYNHLISEYQKIWNDNLVNFNDIAQRNEFLSRIKNNRILKNQVTNKFKVYSLYEFQKKIINCLKSRRKINKNQHLLVMATGTGKTIVSAFDYLNQIQENNYQRPQLLFLAHQQEIIEQALVTFRNVLQDHSFGKIFKRQDPNPNNYLFATIQSVYSNITMFKPDQFSIIIFDEAHHLAARTFEFILNYFKPQQVIGLTATPEREDKKKISHYFDDEYAYELRIWEAINQRLLCSFDYYCIDDIKSNLTGVDLHNDKAVFKVLNTTDRNNLLLDVIVTYIGKEARPYCLIFCITTEHAKIVATFLQANGLLAGYLTTAVANQRQQILKAFKTGGINYLCVVNMFNEGIDVPQIDTIIMLRPTNSKTIYLQQLGRGLRKHATKDKLEVYDLIANIDNKYDLTIGIKQLFNPTPLPKNLQLNFEYQLPYGCTINLEKYSQKLILESLKKWQFNRKNLYLIVQSYYQLDQLAGLKKILVDYQLTLPEFYNWLNDFYLRIGRKIKNYAPNDNNFLRNKNILKQFLFLNDYQLINYFYLRLSQKITLQHINHHYDNLLICSLLYEVTSMKRFLNFFPNYINLDDLVFEFIVNNQLIAQELCLILEYKLINEELINQELVTNPTGLVVKTRLTVRQALCAISAVNFIKQLGPLRIIAFQAGYLTFMTTNCVILADIDANKYGKETKYNPKEQQYWWSIPETKKIGCKLITDLKNPEVKKFLFLNDEINRKFCNLHLKLYTFIGIGVFLELTTAKYLTAKFLVS